jgi:hypothetical protein
VISNPSADSAPSVRISAGSLHLRDVALQELAANSSSNSSNRTLLKKQMTHSCSS